MNNLGILRKILIVVLALLAVGLVVYSVIRIVNDNSKKPEVVEEPQEKVEIKETSKIIEEGKTSLINLNSEGFLEKSVEVPLGGVLQIKNDTDRDIVLDIRTENYIAGLMVAAGESSFSPVFTKTGEYTLSEIVDGQVNEEVSAKIIVK